MDRIAIDAAHNGLALDGAEGERIARAMAGKDIAFLGNHGVIVAGERIAHACDDLYYLERACMQQVLAMSTGRPLAPVSLALSARVARQIQGEREQSEQFFEALSRMLPAQRWRPEKRAAGAAPWNRARIALSIRSSSQRGDAPHRRPAERGRPGPANLARARR